MRTRAPGRYSFLRFDPNNTCNLTCVYCHNGRSSETIDADAFRAFLHENVASVDNFQVGCIMEPTLDSRLVAFLTMIGESPARPKRSFLLQTNGLLLHRHDQEGMARAGLNRLSVSVDTAAPALQKTLRSGMSLDKVLRNVAGFRQACPDIAVEFISTITAINIDAADEIVSLGLELGVSHFVFREVFYYPDSSVVDHARMPDLLLKPGQFAAMVERIRSRFAPEVSLEFAANEVLDAGSRETIKTSGFVGRELGEPRLHA